MKIRVIRPASRQNADPAFMDHSARITSTYASPGTQIETVFIDAGAHGGSMGAHLSEAHIMANAPATVREVIKAEKDGFDAVVLSGEYDVGAEFARHVVRIPVIDAGPVSLHAAALLGDAVAMLVTQRTVTSYVRKLLRRWSMSDFVCTTVAWDLTLAEAWNQKSQMRALTIDLCRTAMERADINVILPFAAVFVPFIIDPREIEDALGLPVVNGVAVGVRTAEMFVDLGMRHSAKAYPVAPASAWS